VDVIMATAGIIIPLQKLFLACNCNDGYLLDLSDNKTCRPCVIRAVCTYGSSIIQGMTLNVSQTQIGNILISQASTSLSSTSISDLNVVSSNITVLKGSILLVGGDLDSSSSQFNIDSSSVIISGNAEFQDTVLRFSGQTNITINGCLNLDNITIDVEEQNVTSEAKNITLFSFKDNNCTYFSQLKFTTEDSLSCKKTSITPTVYKTSVVVTLLEDSSGCDVNAPSETIGIPKWALITISTVLAVIFLVIVVVVAVFASEKLRETVMPFRDIIPEYHHHSKV